MFSWFHHVPIIFHPQLGSLQSSIPPSWAISPYRTLTTIRCSFAAGNRADHCPAAVFELWVCWQTGGAWLGVTGDVTETSGFQETSGEVCWKRWFWKQPLHHNMILWCLWQTQQKIWKWALEQWNHVEPQKCFGLYGGSPKIGRPQTIGVFHGFPRCFPMVSPILGPPRTWLARSLCTSTALDPPSRTTPGLPTVTAST